MYCKKCHTLLEENSPVCKKCKFDNKKNVINTNKKDLQNIINEINESQKHKDYIIPSLITLSVIVLGAILLYSIKDTKSDLKPEPTTTTKIVVDKEATNQFTFNNIKLYYTDEFGSATSTIFYIQNAAINITFRNIELEEYKQLLEANECLDSKLGDIAAKTYAGETSYSYLFMVNDEYYNITVNYSNSRDMTEQIANEINKILKTIEIKKSSK